MFPLLMEGIGGMGMSEGMGSMMAQEGMGDMLTKSGMMGDLMKNPDFLKFMQQQAGGDQPPILTKGWKNRRLS